MIDRVLQIAAPHYCYGCGFIGAILCSNCKYDITDEPFVGCIVCGTVAIDGICKSCQSFYKKAWCASERSGVMTKLLNAYKFERVKAASSDLAQILNESLPVLPAETIVVPLPTIRPHIRQRGYDHTLLVTRSFATLRNVSFRRLLHRNGASMQRGATRKERIEQASRAFSCRERLSPRTPYLVIDDVVTTGASVEFAAKALHNAGARKIWVAAIARQPLDKQ